jgi:thioredoxin 1
MSAIPRLEADDFEEKVINSRRSVVLGFTAAWCDLCRTAEEAMTRLSDQHSGVDFYFIDIDDNEALAAQNKVGGIPAVVVYQNGEECARLVGRENMEGLTDILKGME